MEQEPSNRFPWSSIIWPAVIAGTLVIAGKLLYPKERRYYPRHIETPTVNIENSNTNNSLETKAEAKEEADQPGNEVLLARLIYGEARGESAEIKRAIADSVINRTDQGKWWGNTLEEVIRKPYQYSCFNQNDQNGEKIMNPVGPAWEECLDIAQQTLSSSNTDSSNGATHYFDTSIATPSWAKGKKPVKNMPIRDGREVKFYKLDY